MVSFSFRNRVVIGIEQVTKIAVDINGDTIAHHSGDIAIGFDNQRVATGNFDVEIRHITEVLDYENLPYYGGVVCIDA